MSDNTTRAYSVPFAGVYYVEITLPLDTPDKEFEDKALEACAALRIIQDDALPTHVTSIEVSEWESHRKLVSGNVLYVPQNELDRID
jgi:hypothetical protein